MCECSAYRRTQRSSLAYELAANWCSRTFTQRNQSELSYMARAVDDSTINIVLGYHHHHHHHHHHHYHYYYYYFLRARRDSYLCCKNAALRTSELN